MSRKVGIASSALVGALAVAPIAVSAVVPAGSGPTASAAGVSTGATPSTSESATPLPKMVRAPVKIIDPLVALRVRDPKAGAPLRVTIPSLGVSAPVVPVASVSGILTPPNDPYIWGWWSGSAVAGAAVGSTLITGHTVHNGPAPMNNLDTVKLGALVRVTTPKGIIPYRVILVRIYRKASLAKHAGTVFSQSVAGRLVLITCDNWNGVDYLSNAVVIAVPDRSR